MELICSDGTEIVLLGVHGKSVEYQGIRRDSLLFLMDPEAVSLTTALEVFTPERCDRITLKDDNGEYVHENYTIRIEAGQGDRDYVLTGVGNQAAQEDGPETVVYVRMAQSTLAERTLQEQQDTLDALVLAALGEG